MTKVYDAENLSVVLIAAEMCERAMKSWAERAGVSVNALFAAGIYPVSSQVCSDDGKTVTIRVTPNVRILPIRDRGESESEFIERARRMPW